jgi:hypothetical protein
MNLPSQLQAHVFWLHAAGMNARQIGDSLGCSPQAAQATLDAAKKKAAQIGLIYKIELKEKPETPDNESGMGMALRLAREAQLIR